MQDQNPPPPPPPPPESDRLLPAEIAASLDAFEQEIGLGEPAPGDRAGERKRKIPDMMPDDGTVLEGDPRPVAQMHSENLRLCECLGGMLCKEDVFLRVGIGDVVTVDPQSGKFTPMLPTMLSSWADRHVRTWKLKRGMPHFESMGVDKCAVVLASLDFKKHLREIRTVRGIRQPVSDGLGGARLLDYGHDAETGVYTLNSGMDYPMNVGLQEAYQTLCGLFGSFSWEGKQEGAGWETSEQRKLYGPNFGVYISLLLSVYCQWMLPAGERVPFYRLNANLEGSGKSVLGSIALHFVYGESTGSTLMEGTLESESLEKKLDAWAYELTDYVFFDDFRGRLKSTLLNAWALLSAWKSRILGKTEGIRVPLHCITLFSGNGVRSDPEFSRREMVIDIFALERSHKRVLPEGTEMLSEGWIKNPENRKRMLGAVHAIFREYYAYPQQENLTWDDLRSPKEPYKPSFLSWSRLAPAMTRWASFECPLTPSERSVAVGEADDEDRERLIVAAITKHCEDGLERVIKLEEIAVVAREIGAFAGFMGSVDDVTQELNNNGKWPLREFLTHTFNSDGQISSTEVQNRKPQTSEEREYVAWRYMHHSARTKLGYQMNRVAGMPFRVGDRVWHWGQRMGRGSSFKVSPLESAKS